MGATLRVREVLERLNVLGVKVRAEGNSLLVAPAEKVTPEVKEIVTGHRKELLLALSPAPPKGVGYGCGRCGHRVYTLVATGWQCDRCRATYEVIGGRRGPTHYGREVGKG